MPTFEVQAPDGRTFEIEGEKFPSGEQLKKIYTTFEAESQKSNNNPFQEVIEIFGSQFSAGMDNIKTGELNTKQIFGELDSKEKLELQALENKEYKQYNKINLIYRTTGAVASQLPVIGNIAFDSFKGTAAGAGVGAVAGSVLPGAGTAAGATTGATVGGRMAAFYSAFELETGLMRSELKEEVDTEGKPLSGEIINGASIATGIINGSLEFVGFVNVAKTIPGVKQLTTGAIKSKVKSLIKDEGVRALIAKIGKDYAKGVVTESTTEALQEVTNILASDLARGLPVNKDMKNKMERILNSAIDAALATGVISGVGSTARVAQVKAKQGKAINEAKKEAEQMSDVEKKLFLEENANTMQEIVKEDLDAYNARSQEELNIGENSLTQADVAMLSEYEPIQKLLEGKAKLGKADLEKVKPEREGVGLEAARKLTKNAEQKADIEEYKNDIKESIKIFKQSIKEGKIEEKELSLMKRLANRRSPESKNYEAVTFDILEYATGLSQKQIKSAISKGKTEKISLIIENIEDEVEQFFPEWSEFYGSVDLSELNAGKELAQQAWEVALSEYNTKGFATANDIMMREEVELFEERVKNENISREELKQGLQSYIDVLEKTVKQTEQAIIRQSPKNIVSLTEKAITKINSAFKKGVQEGRKLTKEQISLYQKILTNYINNQPISSDDKVAFLNKVKNVQTEANLLKTIDNIEVALDKVKIKKENKLLRGRIAKILKQKVVEKKGSVRKTVFDFETTQIFKELKKINKYTKKQAQGKITELYLSGFEPKTFEEKLINKLLVYKSTGVNTDNTLLNSLVEDLKNLEVQGKEAKNELELSKKLNKQKAVNDAKDVLSKYEKGSGVVQKLLDIYNDNVANVYSLFNAFGGKSFADKYDPNLKQVKLNNAISLKTKEITEKAQKIFGVKDKYELQKPLADMAKVRPDLVLTKQEEGGISRKLSVLEVMDVYNSIKNEDIAEDYYESFGKENVLNLVSKLTPEQMKFADEIAVIVRGYEQVLNNYSIKKFGLPLAKRANYWPATSEHMSEEYNALETYIPKTQIPSALKIKTTNVTPKPVNAWMKMQKHINHAEYINHMADTYEALNNMFSDNDVKSLVKEKLGDNTLRQINNEIEYLSLNKRFEHQDGHSKLLEKALAGWTVAKVASIPVFTKQLISSVNYAVDMPADKWGQYFKEGLSNPKKTVEFMLSEMEYLKVRYEQGYDDAIAATVREAEQASIPRQKIMNAMTSFTKTGDIGAIIFGGYPYYKHLLESGMSKEKAIDAFISRTEKTQQGRQSSNLSTMQKNGKMLFFSRFLNTPNQYLRLLVDTQIQYERGEIEAGKYKKTMGMYLGFQPVVFSLVGSGFAALGKAATGEDNDWADYFWDAMAQIALVPFNAFPIFADLIDFGLRIATGRETYSLFGGQMLQDLGWAVTSLTSSIDGLWKEDDEFNLAGTLYNLGLILGEPSGIPVKNIGKSIDLATGGEFSEVKSNRKKKKQQKTLSDL